MIQEKYGIKYELPKVYLLKDSGIGIAEIAARTCYDSFENSENKSIQNFDKIINNDPTEEIFLQTMNNINEIDSSELLDTLAWVHHHHSIIEHATLSFLIKGTSRGVLQEHARHRIQSISVRSTRYTMSGIMNAYASFIKTKCTSKDLYEILDSLNFLIIADIKYREIEYDQIINKLNYQREILGNEEFFKISIAKSSLEILNETNTIETMFKKLQEEKKKRNVGDPFKHIVSDNWKVDMVVTFNIRSLKNYFDLRDSGAAWFQIKWLAEKMKKVTPVKYLKLIDKEYRTK